MYRDLRLLFSHKQRMIITGLLIIIVTLALFLIFAEFQDKTADTIQFHVLAVNDLHGQITSGQTQNGSNVGSFPVLASYLRDAITRYGSNHTIIALPGDFSGASPVESNLLLDEPTILFINGLVNGNWKNSQPNNSSGIKIVATVGNHEFDRNYTELKRLITGGNGNTTINHIIDPYPGALWPVVVTNVYRNETTDHILRPYQIVMVEGVQVAFIGAVTIQTPETTTPESVKGLTFTDEADEINKQVKTLQKQGVHAFIILLHEGGTQTPYTGKTREKGDLSGRVVSITSRLDEDVDVVLSGHSHEFTNTFLPNAGGQATLVTQSYAYSKDYADVNLTIDKRSKDIIQKSAEIIPTLTDSGPGLHPDNNTQELLDSVNITVQSETSTVIENTTIPLTCTPDMNGESNLYDLVTDSMRWSMNADMAIINEGALRADIDAGEITNGEAFSVMPFHDQILLVNLTGADIWDLLNQQWNRTIKPDHMLQISGFSYTWDASRNDTRRVVSITRNGSSIRMNESYKVAATDFLSYGGDGYSVMKKGTIIDYGMYDVDIFIKYLQSLPSPLYAQTRDRITILNRN